MVSRHPGRRRPSLRSRALWFVRARPVDYMLAMSEFYATLPLVGKHLEPLGGFTAMAQEPGRPVLLPATHGSVALGPAGRNESV